MTHGRPPDARIGVVPAPKRVLIVYHSLTGGTRQLAEAAAQGARASGEVEVTLLTAPAADAEAVLQADGYIFATPENLAAMSGLLKDFFDRTYYAALERLNGRPYLSLVCAGSDGRTAAAQIERIATGWRLRAIAEPCIVCVRATTPEQILAPKQMPQHALARCEELGATLAGGLALGIY